MFTFRISSLFYNLFFVKMSSSSKPLSRHSSGHQEDKEDGRGGQGEPPQYENVENRGQYCQVYYTFFIFN